jgi:hypothetical protein
LKKTMADINEILNKLRATRGGDSPPVAFGRAGGVPPGAQLRPVSGVRSASGSPVMQQDFGARRAPQVIEPILSTRPPVNLPSQAAPVQAAPVAPLARFAPGAPPAQAEVRPFRPTPYSTEALPGGAPLDPGTTGGGGVEIPGVQRGRMQIAGAEFGGDEPVRYTDEELGEHPEDDEAVEGGMANLSHERQGQYLDEMYARQEAQKRFMEVMEALQADKNSAQTSAIKRLPGRGFSFGPPAGGIVPLGRGGATIPNFADGGPIDFLQRERDDRQKQELQRSAFLKRAPRYAGGGAVTRAMLGPAVAGDSAHRLADLQDLLWQMQQGQVVTPDPQAAPTEDPEAQPSEFMEPIAQHFAEGGLVGMPPGAPPGPPAGAQVAGAVPPPPPMFLPPQATPGATAGPSGIPPPPGGPAAPIGALAMMGQQLMEQQKGLAQSYNLPAGMAAGQAGGAPAGGPPIDGPGVGLPSGETGGGAPAGGLPPDTMRGPNVQDALAQKLSGPRFASGGVVKMALRDPKMARKYGGGCTCD